MTSKDIVQKLWSPCDDGINYSDYVTELVLLLFIKMEYENKPPEGCRWQQDLNNRGGLNLLNHYKQMLLDLSQSEDQLISAIYMDAQPRLRSANLIFKEILMKSQTLLCAALLLGASALPVLADKMPDL